MANESKSDSPEKVIQIRRCACVVKGGRRFSFTATVVVGDKKAELHVQRKFSGAVYNPYAEPEGGSYFLVAEVTPLGPGRSKIDITGTRVGADELIRAVTGWATGQDLGCPDMTKT